MKKKHVLVAFCALFVVAGVAFVADRTFVGHWKVSYGTGHTGHVVFRNDGTVEATFDGEIWKVGGPYKVEGGTLSISDSSCGLGYWSRYKANWFSDDSIRMTLIADTCTGRRTDVDGSVLVREK
jgi:hypothetical protein